MNGPRLLPNDEIRYADLLMENEPHKMKLARILQTVAFRDTRPALTNNDRPAPLYLFMADNLCNDLHLFKVFTEILLETANACSKDPN